MSALPQRMNCLPASTVNGPRVKVAASRRIEIRGRRAPRSPMSTRQSSVDLIVRVGAEIDPGSELHPRSRLDEQLVSNQNVADRARRIVRRLLRKEHDAALDESALRERLSGGRSRHQRNATAAARNRSGPSACQPSALPVLPARSLSPDCLQREVFFLHRDVVFELVERESRAAAAFEVGHLHLPRRPDALHVADVRVIRAGGRRRP